MPTAGVALTAGVAACAVGEADSGTPIEAGAPGAVLDEFAVAIGVATALADGALVVGTTVEATPVFDDVAHDTARNATHTNDAVRLPIYFSQRTGHEPLFGPITSRVAMNSVSPPVARSRSRELLEPLNALAPANRS